MEIKEGMTVWHKAGGGPSMIVKSYINNKDEWACTWFKDGELKEENFKPHELTDEDPDTLDIGDLM